MSEADDKQKVIEACREWARDLPAPLRRAVLGNLKQSIRLVPPEKPETHKPLGASRIGGDPDLPDGVEWPSFRGFEGTPDEAAWAPHVGAPLPFLAQINLGEVAPLDGEGVLPKTGMLYFFFLDANEVFGRFAEQGEICRVLHVPSPPVSLSRVDPPDALPIKLRYDAMLVHARREWTLPNPYDIVAQETPREMIDAHVRFWDHSADLAQVQGFGPFYQPRHRILGHPDLIQTFRLEPGVRLLLQVDSDSPLSDYPKTGMRFGESGRVYFLVGEADLATQRLERARAHFECE